MRTKFSTKHVVFFLSHPFMKCSPGSQKPTIRPSCKSSKNIFLVCCDSYFSKYPAERELKLVKMFGFCGAQFEENYHLTVNLPSPFASLSMSVFTDPSLNTTIQSSTSQCTHRLIYFYSEAIPFFFFFTFHHSSVLFVPIHTFIHPSL